MELSESFMYKTNGQDEKKQISYTYITIIKLFTFYITRLLILRIPLQSSLFKCHPSAPRGGKITSTEDKMVDRKTWRREMQGKYIFRSKNIYIPEPKLF